MELNHLQVNHMENPIGCAYEPLTFSWVAEDCGPVPCHTRVEIARDASFSDLLHDSGFGSPDRLSYCPEISLPPRTRCYWRVTVRPDDGGGDVSRTAFFETAKEDEPWQAEWIRAPFSAHPVFRRTFRAEGTEQARLYACGLGLYEVTLNGKNVTDEVLMPGYHSYDRRIMYQTLILDGLLNEGENTLEVMLAPGWYMGRFGFNGGAENLYGDTMTLLAELHVGGQVIGSDDSWLCAEGPVQTSNIYDGEVWDAAKETPGVWQKAVPLPEEQAKSLFGRLKARTNLPILRCQPLEPVEVIRTPGGDTLLDFGQNLAGWFTFQCTEPAGTRITLAASEILQDGEFYRDNLRTAKAEYTYLSDGRPAEVRPHFTFFGFRYLKVTGISDLEKAGVRAVPLTSGTRRTGHLTTSDPLVNRLIENTLWGQRSNFIDVPTDCPQRDERMGWTGDTQIFCGTACYNSDSAAFYAKFMEDVRLEQELLDGSVPFVVPSPKIDLMQLGTPMNGSCAWGDAATIVPWTVYQFYGDKALLEKDYPGMKAWVEYIRARESEEHLWLTGFHFADWLALDNPKPGPFGRTDVYFCASAYYYYSTLLVARAAAVLGKEDEAKEYSALAADIREAFLNRYFDGEGNCTEDTQTACVVALMFGLCPEGKEEALASRLHEKLMERQMHLDTGFIGTGYLCRVLAEHGLQEDAVSLLLTKDMPGWLYPVLMGATTIWERWNSVMPDGHMNPDGMNSLNHYAYGSVCEWMYRDLAGLSPLEPGFRKVLFAPKPDGRLSYVKGEYESASGTFRFGWEKAGGGYAYHLTVPGGSRAVVRLPGCPEKEVGPGDYRM